MANQRARPPQRPTPAAAPRDQTRTVILIAVVVAVVAVIGVAIALLVGGGDDDEGAVASVPMTEEGLADCSAVPSPSVESAASPGTTPVLAEFPAGDIFKPVAVDGQDLPPFDQEVREGAEPDTALCRAAPIVSGYDYEGNEITIDPATDGPTMVVLLAHWCPHCNAEVPVLNEWRDSGEFPDGLNVVGVSTGVSADAPNYPPDEWLVEMDWQWPVLVDDRTPDDGSAPPAMAAYGGTSYPTLVFIDDDGLVRQRLSGEVPTDVFAPLAEALVADT